MDTKEHQEFGKDLLKVIVSWTPLSGPVDSIALVHKWGIKKRIGEKLIGFFRSL